MLPGSYGLLLLRSHPCKIPIFIYENLAANANDCASFRKAIHILIENLPANAALIKSPITVTELLYCLEIHNSSPLRVNGKCVVAPARGGEYVVLLRWVKYPCPGIKGGFSRQKGGFFCLVRLFDNGSLLDRGSYRYHVCLAC